MDEQDRGPKLSPEIYVYATNKNFLNLYDALRIGKVKVEIAGYDPDNHRQTGHAGAWIDKDDARLLSHLVCNRLFASVTGGKWEKYGGSQRDDGNLESRTLLVEWDEGDGGRFSRFPYRMTVSNGPGKRTSTGGVAPAGEPHARLTMRLPEADMIKLMLALGDYIHAYETAHHHRMVAERLRELREKLAGRAPQPEARVPDHVRAPAARSAVAEAREPYRADSDGEAQAAGTASPQPLQGRPPLRAIPGGNQTPLNLPSRPERSRANRAG